MFCPHFLFPLLLLHCSGEKIISFASEAQDFPKLPEQTTFSPNGKFPKGFKWGVATSAYQVEGGWNADGKGPSIWDQLVHTRTRIISDGSTGDVSCDSYHNFAEDVQRIKSLSADFYRFSISWSRILPNGTIDDINPAGIQYYNNLIDELVKNKIEPIVTLHHYDTPDSLMVHGGWPSEELIQPFADYARLAFQNFGDRVKRWITFNEPLVTCVVGYGDGVHAPGIQEPAELPYKCAHTILKAHAKAYRIYETEFKVKQNGQVGMTINTGRWFEPASEKPEDIAAAERARQFQYGWFAHPLVFGSYPPIMRKLVDNRSLSEGRNVSRLPEFNSTWSSLIKGSIDFFGVNQYTTETVQDIVDGPSGWRGDQLNLRNESNWIPGTSCSVPLKPHGFRSVLNWIKTEYANPEMLITENGYCSTSLAATSLNDTERVSYYRANINSLLSAVVLDKCNVVGYTAWSLMDNFEWLYGYTAKYGIYAVDFTKPDRPRLPRASATFLKTIFQNNGFADI